MTMPDAAAVATAEGAKTGTRRNSFLVPVVAQGAHTPSRGAHGSALSMSDAARREQDRRICAEKKAAQAERGGGERLARASANVYPCEPDPSAASVDAPTSTASCFDDATMHFSLILPIVIFGLQRTC